jgi:hypothetical protein
MMLEQAQRLDKAARPMVSIKRRPTGRDADHQVDRAARAVAEAAQQATARREAGDFSRTLFAVLMLRQN